MYGNENEVGEGLKEAFDSGIKREDIFVTSKLWNTYHRYVRTGMRRLHKSTLEIPPSSKHADALAANQKSALMRVSRDWAWITSTCTSSTGRYR